MLASAQARDHVNHVEIGARRDGTLLAVQSTLICDSGAYSVYPVTASLEPLTAAGILPGPYKLAALAYDAYAVATNKCPAGAYRGVGMALGLRLRDSAARVFVELSDGEMQEGANWEAALAAAHFRLHDLVALIDCNGIQADGALVLDMEPVAAKWQAFGWATQEIDGNDLAAVAAALAQARAAEGRPHAIVLRTRPGYGVPTLERREKAHFVRVEPGEWDALRTELDRHAEAARG